MVTNIRFLLVIIISIFSIGLVGQDDESYESSRTIFFDIQLNYTDYDGNFNKNLKDPNSVGFGISGLMQSSLESPWFYGVEINYLQIYSVNTNFDDFIDGRFVNINSSSTTSLFNFTPKIRYYVPFSYLSVYPFAELGFNYKWIYTYNSEFFDDNDEADTSLYESSGSIGYIGGVGINILITDNYYLLAKAVYNYGASTDYYIEAPFIDNNATSKASLILKNSTTNLINYQLGMTILF